jgi:hypothetical protein
MNGGGNNGKSGRFKKSYMVTGTGFKMWHPRCPTGDSLSFSKYEMTEHPISSEQEYISDADIPFPDLDPD